MSSPPPRDRAAILAVLAVVLGVLLVGGAAFVLLGRPSPAPPAPSVDLAPPEFGAPGDAVVNVTAVSDELDLGLFRVELRDVLGGNLLLFSETLRPGVLWTSGAATVRLRDEPAAGRLTAGDGFVLENLPTQKTYSLTLVYAPESRTLDSVTIPL